MNLSDFGRKMSNANNIQAMFDEMTSVYEDGRVVAMFGGGNPAIIPSVVEVYQDHMQRLFADPKTAGEVVGKYDNPRGNAAFIQAITSFLNRHYQFGITEENVVVTAGSQTGFFILFNILAGKTGQVHKKILLPCVPEYIGYFDQGIEAGAFVSVRPRIEKRGEHEFAYHIDVDSLDFGPDIAAMCLSRPTNPTGNVVPDSQIAALGKLARDHDVPLLIDNAYGLPFPGILAVDTELNWDGHTVHSFTLSKAGLPGLRVGIFVGPADLMKVVSKANGAIAECAPGIGQHMMRSMLEDDSVVDLCDRLIRPYYAERAAKARELIERHFPADLPWRLHSNHGTFFFWLWLEGAKMTSQEVHDYLKERGVIVVPGEHFFAGQDARAWAHAHECMRINFARPDSELEAGIPLLGEAVGRAYRGGGK